MRSNCRDLDSHFRSTGYQINGHPFTKFFSDHQGSLEKIGVNAIKLSNRTVSYQLNQADPKYGKIYRLEVEGGELFKDEHWKKALLVDKFSAAGRYEVAVNFRDGLGQFLLTKLFSPLSAILNNDRTMRNDTKVSITVDNPYVMHTILSCSPLMVDLELVDVNLIPVRAPKGQITRLDLLYKKGYEDEDSMYHHMVRTKSLFGLVEVEGEKAQTAAEVLKLRMRHKREDKFDSEEDKALWKSMRKTIYENIVHGLKDRTARPSSVDVDEKFPFGIEEVQLVFRKKTHRV